MKATMLYRTAALLLIFFAAEHTVGFLKFTPPTAQALAARDAMNSVHFEVGKASFSYGGFYLGFGLFVTAYLLFSAFLGWHLGGLARNNPTAIGSLAWAFVGVQVASAVPASLSAVLVICLGRAGWLVLRPEKTLAQNQLTNLGG